MSTAKENPCRKFQANIFNKSKCQNCFKPRELHLLTDQDLTQAKPIYGGWLCLAPEGTDFDNPMQRSRKWQRRFFVLYEHGCLRFALDESRSTLPQGTVNMNLCTDVIDAEPKTGQKNALCIITPEQEYFIRGENKEIINGWSEQLVVYPKTNKQNQKKKRKVEPATTLEPGPAKVAVTGSGIPEADPGPDSSSIIWQEELSQREVEGATVWSAADLSPLGALPSPAGDVSSDAGSLNGDEVDRAAAAAPQTCSAAAGPGGDLLSPTGSCSSLGGVPRCLSPVASDPFPSGSSLLSNGSHISGSLSSLDSDASGSTVTSNDSHPAAQRGAYPHAGLHHDTPRARRLEAEARKAEKRSRVRSPERHQRPSVLSPESRSGVIEKLEALELENAEKMEVEETEVGRSAARQGRHENRRFHRQDQDPDFPSTRPPLRRAKSLDRRTTESVMTPDLLNFKKGWMVKLEEPGQCQKYWFVLTDHSLRYYKDSIAEEASDLDGEIELATCYNVTEYQAQRNYGFQIHTLEGVHTLSAMTAGIRRNWIQAVMKNVRPSPAPDVASSTEDHGAFTPLDGLVRPDVTQDSPSSEASSVEREAAPGHKKSRAAERRREGRSKTFDWAEFRPIAQALAQQRAQEAEGLSADMADVERSRRREERRKRYDAATAPPEAAPSGGEGGRMDCEGGAGAAVHAEVVAAAAAPAERKQRVEEVIEQHWQQVEQTPLREEKRVPLPVALQPRDTAELERLLESYKRGVDDLKTQLEGCHQQLVDSSQHKQELEVQLRTALEREHDVRSGYISPLEHPMGMEADLAPQMKRAELVSSQAQSLTKKYQETKELLQLQELKKRNMQAQLGLSLSHLTHTDPCPPDDPLEGPLPEPVQKTVSFLLSDSADGIQELEDLMTGAPMSLQGLLRLLQCHSCSQVLGEQGHYQKLLGRWKHQQDVENETIRKSLVRAGESIRDYESRLLTMEDMVGKAQRQKSEGPGGSSYGPSLKTETIPSNETTNDVAIGMLAQRVELLTGENGALNQRYQEIVNQLTEADREIDRLKAELLALQGSKQHRLVTEELGRVKAELAENQASAIDREYYERELNERALRLHEALGTLEELGNTLRDTERRLQLREATLKGLGFQEDEDEDEMRLNTERLKELLEASEAKLYEKEAAVKSTERRCVELEAQKSELMIQKEESERIVMQKLAEAGAEIRRLQERVGVEMKAGRGEPTMHVSKEAIQTCETQVVEAGLLKQVVNDIGMKSEAVSAVVEMFGHVDVKVEKMFGDLKSTLLVTDSLCSSQEETSTVNQKHMKRLVLEAEFWTQLLTIKESGKGTTPDFGRHVAVRMLAEKSLLFLTCRLCPPANEDGNSVIPVTEADFSAMFTWLDEKTNALILKELRQTLEEKAYLLKQMITSIDLSKDDQLRSLAFKTFNSDGQQKPPSEYLLDALKDAYMLYVTIRIKLENERELMHKQAELRTGSVGCCNCPKLRDINRDLSSKLTDLQSHLSEAISMTAGGPPAHIQIDGEPIASLDKTTELQDTIARHRKELREVKDVYEQEAEALRKEVVKASEALRLLSEENVQEIDSLTECMANMKKKHDAERSALLERFQGEMEELSCVVTPLSPVPGAAGGSGEPTPTPSPSGQALPQTLNLKERIQELVTQVTAMTGEMRRREQQGDASALRRKYDKDLEHLKATCERGFAAMEDSHQRVVDELQRKHQRELENLQEEKDRLLAEETAATIAAIEAMRNAHRSELEKELEKARKTNNHAENADLDEIHRQHEEELCSFQREIEVLSEQYSQKCLENAHLAQALEAERQALRQCQRENQELNAHNQELNNRLAAEITKMRSMASEDGDSGVGMQGKELYELEVMLRVKESEVQYLKQEINSLKDELQAAQRDKKYATDKYKDIYTELSIVKAKAERDLGRLRDQLQLAHEALGGPSLEEVERGGYDIMKSKSNPDILKMAAAAAKRSERTLRSKSLKEGLTAEQRLHLFDNKDTKEF
ncbi:myosin phosphatase Rho-interacting protein isoform X1 [Gadus morhua]|uniref:myosin phosphatase Rho-interacting protein isoform X1 n=1 Tax=Gadus morhua TaxID=8049 RepID=UPI0011B695DA|nr:myosin phosphatase Rho-interacting protein-like isoform X1 [Gadus morhua]